MVVRNVWMMEELDKSQELRSHFQSFLKGLNFWDIGGSYIRGETSIRVCYSDNRVVLNDIIFSEQGLAEGELEAFVDILIHEAQQNQFNIRILSPGRHRALFQEMGFQSYDSFEDLDFCYGQKNSIKSSNSKFWYFILGLVIILAILNFVLI